MKRNRLINELGGIDDRYVAEAYGEKKRSKRITLKKKKSKFIKIGALAACLTIIVGALGLWLFLPNNPERDIYAYRNSEYYPIIKMFNAYNTKHEYDNKFDEIMSNIQQGFDDIKNGAAGGDAAPGGNMAGSSGNTSNDNMESGSPGSSYEEVTDNQVAGVIEADLIKRSSTHIFYLSGNILSAYEIAGEDTACVGTIKITSDGYSTGKSAEMYLSLDCKRITVITQRTEKNSGSFTEIISLNVEDPTNISVINKVSITGYYTTSRLQNGNLLFISEFAPVKNKIDFSKPETFLPTIDTGDGLYPIAAENIVLPENLNSMRYTVVTSLSENGLELIGAAAFLSYTDQIYVSENSVYASYTEYKNVENENPEFNYAKRITDITRVKYNGGFELCGTARIEGFTKDQYSFDEYNGVLRVAVTTHAYRTHYTSHQMPESIKNILGYNASLYCIDIETMETITAVKNFAPRGEQVRSARFDGNMAYVCTSVIFTDPVFFFDLSDLGNITYTDTGTIEGYSSSLINFGDGYLLGIGLLDWSTVKIEVYEELGGKVVSVAKKEYENATYSEEYKSYLIDREAGLLGFGIMRYKSKYISEYILLYFDGYELTEIAVENITGSLDTVRGVVIEDYLYIFTDNDFRVTALN